MYSIYVDIYFVIYLVSELLVGATWNPDTHLTYKKRDRSISHPSTFLPCQKVPFVGSSSRCFTVPGETARDGE